MKKAVVVGATSGIGRELSVLFAQNGYQVGIVGRRESLLQELVKLYPQKILAKVLDVAVTTSIQKILDEISKELGGVDIVVISSGTGDINKNLDFDIEKTTIDTNVLGFTAVSDWAFNHFKHQNAGHLVAITSIAGLRGSNDAPAYSATKAYQINYLEGLKKLAFKLRSPIVITDIRPGYVDTAMAKGEKKFWVSNVIKASKQIFNAITEKRTVVYITKRWRIISWILKFLPRGIYKRI